MHKDISTLGLSTSVHNIGVLSVIKWFEVVVFLDGEEVYRDIVRSKESRTAITNVLTNKYKGDVTSVTVSEVVATRQVVKRDMEE